MAVRYMSSELQGAAGLPCNLGTDTSTYSKPQKWTDLQGRTYGEKREIRTEPGAFWHSRAGERRRTN